MTAANLINEIACLLIFINATLFYIYLFTKDNDSIDKLPVYEQWAVRVGLALVSAGSFYNVIIVSYPPWPEIIINVGLAFIFSWAAYFHYRMFVKK